VSETFTLKVAGTSNPSKIATSIVKSIEEGKDVETLSIGAGATNQAIKAIAIARGLASPHGGDLSCKPAFVDLLINGETKTAIKIIVIVNR